MILFLFNINFKKMLKHQGLISRSTKSLNIQFGNVLNLRKLIPQQNPIKNNINSITERRYSLLRGEYVFKISK